MEKELLFALISTGIYLTGIIPYWRDVLRGRTFPHPFATWAWLILVGYNTFVFYQNGEYIALIPSSLMVFSLLVFWVLLGIRSFWKIKINWFDYVCLFLSFWTLIYWYLARNSLNTVILTTLVDFIAFLPVFKKWWLQPWTETILSYFTSSVNQVFTLLAIVSPNSETTIFWLYLLFANFIFFLMVFFRRWYLRGWKSVFE